VPYFPHQADFLADGGDEFPGLSPLDMLLGPGIEEEIALAVFQDERICLKVFNQSYLNALVDADFMALSSLLFLDPKAISDFPIVANELIDPEFQKVRNPQSSIDSHHKQQ
jgi:hypothetical protein